MNTREKLVAKVETKHCPLSTDGGGWESNHRIKEGACTICDRSTDALAVQHGL